MHKPFGVFAVATALLFTLPACSEGESTRGAHSSLKTELCEGLTVEESREIVAYRTNADGNYGGNSGNGGADTSHNVGGEFAAGDSAPSANRPLEQRIAPDLLERVLQYRANPKHDEQIEVVIVFEDPVSTPRFPSGADDEPRDSEANLQVQAERLRLTTALACLRNDFYNEIVPTLASDFGIEELTRDGFIAAISASVSVSQIDALSSFPRVQYVEYLETPNPVLPPVH